jgi:hypothetical protein
VYLGANTALAQTFRSAQKFFAASAPTALTVAQVAMRKCQPLASFQLTSE